MLIINPGTEDRAGATGTNAKEIVERLIKRSGLAATSARNESNDFGGGFFGYTVTFEGKSVDVVAPGDDPDETVLSKPFKSRRLYVDGSSWLFKYAVSALLAIFEKGEN